METTIGYLGYSGIIEKKMEAYYSICIIPKKYPLRPSYGHCISLVSSRPTSLKKLPCATDFGTLGLRGPVFRHCLVIQRRLVSIDSPKLG